jgi:hypothetical protein
MLHRNELRTQCCFCGKPIVREPYRTSDGRFWCHEFCAEDAEEAQFQQQRRKVSKGAVTEPARAGGGGH